MLHIKEVIIVEGNHDKIKLQQITDAMIITTNGFSIYKNKEKLAIIKNLAQKKGLIILTDSDSAGKRIRAYIKNCIGNIPVKHAYIPQIEGKERRKEKAGKEGMLGVEGMTAEVLERVLLRAGCMLSEKMDAPKISKTDFYEYGLIGKNQSKAMRKELAKKLDLPLNLSANALLEVVNSLYTPEEYKAAAQSIITKFD